MNDFIMLNMLGREVRIMNKNCTMIRHEKKCQVHLTIILIACTQKFHNSFLFLDYVNNKFYDVYLFVFKNLLLMLQ